MKIENRQQLLAVVALGAVALLGFDWLVLKHLTRAWKERSTRIAELRSSVSQGALLLDREPAIRSRWDSMKTNTLPTTCPRLVKCSRRSIAGRRTAGSTFRPSMQRKQTSEDFMTGMSCRRLRQPVGAD